MLRLLGKSYPNLFSLNRRFLERPRCGCFGSRTLTNYGRSLAHDTDRSVFRERPSSNFKFHVVNFVSHATEDGSILRDKVVDQSKHGTSKSLLSLRRLDATNTDAKDRLGRRWKGRTSVGWFAGAGAIAVLLLVAAAVPTKDEDGGRLDKTLVTIVSKAVADLWDSAAHIVKGVASMFEGLLNALSGVPSKALQTAIAAVVLVQCMNAILVCKGEGAANELALRWRLSVASLIADLAGASHSSRRALMEAGNGAAVDWLLEAIGHGEIECRLIQSEAARAVTYFLSDDGTCEDLLGRPNALSHLLLFTSSIEPRIQTSKHKKLQLSLTEESSRGRSMLVAGIMDIVTSNCKIDDKSGFRPKLSQIADAKDVATALDVIKEGGLCLDESQDDNEGGGEDKGGLHGLGIRVLGGTNVVGVQNNQHLHCLLGLAQTFLFHWGGCLAAWWNSYQYWQTFPSSRPDFYKANSLNPGEIMKLQENASSYGLWDDLEGRYVAVPLATWAVATWAQASSGNCATIAEVDKYGDALMVAVMAPERTVKWHGAMAVHCLLENGSEEPAVTWSCALLRMAIQASNVEDAELALVALNSFYSCIRRSASAQKVVSEKSLPLMRELAKHTRKNISIQKVLAQALEVLSLNGAGLSLEEGKKWSSILLHWTCNHSSEGITRSAAARVLGHVLDGLGQGGIPLSQAWLAMLLTDAIHRVRVDFAKGDRSSVKTKAKGLVQSKTNQTASQAATELAKVVWLSVGDEQEVAPMTTNVSDTPWGDLLTLDIFQNLIKGIRKDPKIKVRAADAAMAALKAMKALTELSAEDKTSQLKIIEAGGLHLLRRFMLSDDYEKWYALEMREASKMVAGGLKQNNVSNSHQAEVQAVNILELKAPLAAHLRKHAARLLSVLALQSSASAVIKEDEAWCRWLEDCADGRILGCNDLKSLSYARATLLNVEISAISSGQLGPHLQNREKKDLAHGELLAPHYADKVFLLNTESPYWKHLPGWASSCESLDREADDTISIGTNSNMESQAGNCNHDFDVDVVFVHGLRGGPFKTWRIADDKASTTGKAGFVEKIDVDSGREGTCWPKQWLASDLPACRLLTLKYKTNFSQWSGATLPLQEVSAMLLDKLLAAGVGHRPVVFITHSMGGLVVKEMLMQAWQDKSRSHIVKKTSGIVFYSCPHFGSKLADVPWRFGLVLRPAPSIGELRSGSTRLEDLNQFIRTLHKGGLEVISFSETKVTPLVEGYGGWALRMEVVPIESAYPGFGELVVLDGTDHVNSCKPLSRDDVAYTQTLQFLQKLIKSSQRSGTQ